MDILICDDEPLAVERLSRLVTQLGHHVIATAQHGVEVLDLVHIQFLTEYHLPLLLQELNGMEMLVMVNSSVIL